MKAVLLAAGRGTRLAPYSAIIPKPLMPVSLSEDGAFIPIIDVLIDQIKRSGVEEIVVVVQYLAESLLRHLGDGSRFGIKLAYVCQETLDGNAGAFYRAQHLVSDGDVIVTDTDNYLSDPDIFARMATQHRKEGAACTVAVSRVQNVSKFAIIKVDELGNAVDIFEKPASDAGWGNLAKSGMMILSPELAALDREISRAPNGEFTTTGIIQYCLKNKLPVSLFHLEEGFNDIGTWNEYLGVLRRTFRI